MDIEVTVTGKRGEDYPEEYFTSPDRQQMFFKAAEDKIRKMLNLSENVPIKFVVV